MAENGGIGSFIQEHIFNYAVIVENYHFFLIGIGNTLSLVALSLLIGGAISLPLAVLRAERHPVFSPLIWVYTYFFRGTPLLIQTFLIYYGMGQFEVIRESFLWPILSQAWWCALIAFSLNSAAYTTEIFRGAIESVPHGEVEAAKAAGMSRFTMMRRVILPSALRRALPAYSNEVIFMLHGSVVASTVTVIDILGAGRVVNAQYYIYLEGFLTAAILYMILVYLISRGFKIWEHYWHAHLRPRPQDAAAGPVDIAGDPPGIGVQRP